MSSPMLAPAALSVRPAGDTVLGTRVFDVDGGDRRTVVLSDLHVPAGGGPVVQWLAELLRSACDQGARVLVLGDLFDSYVSPAQLRTGVWREVAGLFRAAAEAGAGIAVLHGNRDFLLGAEWERATATAVVAGAARTVLGGRRALLLHGDELCLNDLPYQRAKKWLRRPTVRALARRLPLRAALWVAARARRKSRRVIASGDPARFLPTRAAIEQALALGAGVDLLVFGHIHRLARGTVGGGEYVVLPAFDRDGVRLQVTADGPGFHARTGTAPVPGPLPLA